MKAKIKYCLIFAFVFFIRINLVMAESKSQPEHGGSGGGSEAKSGEEKPWLEVQNEISALRTKSKQLDDKLKEMIHTKLHSGSNPELEKEIHNTYLELKSANIELRKQIQVYKFRFPERAALKKERVYDVDEIPSLDKVEEQVGIDGKLQRNLKKMKAQYGEPKKLQQVKKEYKIKDQPSRTPEQDQTIRESDSPILRK